MAYAADSPLMDQGASGAPPPEQAPDGAQRPRRRRGLVVPGSEMRPTDMTPQPVAGPDPLAFAPPDQALDAGGIKPPAPAPAQSGATWFSGPQAVDTLPTPEASAFNYMDARGSPQTAASPEAVPGQAGYVSAPLVDRAAGGNQTPDATPGNQFAGYVGPQGGGFGGNATDTTGALADLQQITGVDPAKFGLGANSTPDQINAIKQQMAAIANGDKGAMIQALSSTNPFVQQTAKAYLSGRGAQGFDQGEWDSYLQRGTPEFQASHAGYAPGASADVLAAVNGAKGQPPGAVDLGGRGTITSTAPTDTGGAPKPQTLSDLLAPQNAGVGNGPGNYQTTEDNALTNQTIGAPAQNDPFRIAQSQWENFAKASDPQYQASLRDALRSGAAAGGLGSGQLRTSLGDLANQRALQLDTQKNDLLNRALGTQNENAYRNVGIAQQQQGFQNQQQQQAFGNELQRLGLGNELQNSAFGRELQRLGMGEQLTQGAYGREAGRLNLQDALQNSAFGRELQRLGMGENLTQGAFGREQQRLRTNEDLTQGAYNREAGRLGLNDQLTGSAFLRALQQMQTGQAGNPADMQLALSGLFGQQAGQAGQSLSQLIAALAQQKAAAATPNIGGGGSAPPSGLGQSFTDWLRQQGPLTKPNTGYNLGIGGQATNYGLPAPDLGIGQSGSPWNLGQPKSKYNLGIGD